MSPKPRQDDPLNQPFPISPPARRPTDAEHPEGSERRPDLRIEEIEERHVPKDRNIFDK